MTQRILIVASTSAVLERAKALGLEVVLVHKKELLTPKHVELADHLIMINYHDQKLMHALVHSFVELYPVGAVVTFAEDALLPAAELAASLGLERNPIDVVYLLKDKYRMRSFLQERDFSFVAYARGYSVEDVLHFAEQYGYPCIIKPLDATGSFGIQKIHSAEEALALIPQWLEQKAQREFLIEEYLDGHEISVESFSAGGEHRILAITDKLVQENFVEIGHSMPAALPAAITEEVVAFTKAFLDCVGLQFGPAHTEIKITSKGLRIIESHNRPGGDGIYDLVKLVSGVDVCTWSYEYIFSGQLSEPKPVCGGAAVRFLNPPLGQVIAMNPPETLADHPNVHQYSVALKVGDQVPKIEKSRDRKGSVMCKGTSAAEAVRNCEVALESLSVKVAVS